MDARRVNRLVDVSTRTIRRVLVQVATSLPRFLFALPAGVLADSVDLRKLLILI
jgi:hypothetical protein